jgi:hypothetical protein
MSYILSRKNGSFPGGKRTLRFLSYNDMRSYLRSYMRHFTGSKWQRSNHPPMWLIQQFTHVIIKKGI